MQSLVNEKSVSSPNLSESTSTLIMERYVQGPELELWYALLHEWGDHWCIKRCLWGDLLHFLISLCERIKPGPFAATDCHPGNRPLGDLCQMLLLKAGQGALISTVGCMLSLCVSVCVCVLFDVRQYTVSPRCSTPHQGCVLRNPPRCHPHLHASFLHPPLSEGPSLSTHNFYSGGLQVLKKSETLICSYISL